MLPLLLLAVSPLSTLGAFLSQSRSAAVEAQALLGVTSYTHLLDLWMYLLFPVMVAMAGVLSPSTTAMHMVVAEKDRRTLELLVMLPVSVGEILAGKLLASLVVASVSLVPLYLLDVAVMATAGVGSWTYWGAMGALLVAGIAASVGVSLLIALLARDFRTANNLNGLLSLPMVMVSGLALNNIRGIEGILVMAAVLLALALLSVAAAFKWLSFERYMM
jgi:ABC-type Na+ efflux pump permease subunit